MLLYLLLCCVRPALSPPRECFTSRIFIWLLSGICFQDRELSSALNICSGKLSFLHDQLIQSFPKSFLCLPSAIADPPLTLTFCDEQRSLNPAPPRATTQGQQAIQRQSPDQPSLWPWSSWCRKGYAFGSRLPSWSREASPRLIQTLPVLLVSLPQWSRPFNSFHHVVLVLQDHRWDGMAPQSKWDRLPQSKSSVPLNSSPQSRHSAWPLTGNEFRAH